MLKKRRKVVVVIACPKLQVIDLHSTTKQRNQQTLRRKRWARSTILGTVRNAVGSVDLDPHPIRARAGVCVRATQPRMGEKKKALLCAPCLVVAEDNGKRNRDFP